MDRDARDAELLRCRRVAYLAALQLIGNQDDALDIAQDAIVRLLRTMPTLDTGRPWHPYVIRVVTNLVHDVWRRRRVRRAESLEALVADRGFDPADRSADPERRAVEADACRHLARGLSSLDEHHREILVLRDFQDLSYAEIADVLSIPIGTVMSRLHKARVLLRDSLREARRTP